MAEIWRTAYLHFMYSLKTKVSIPKGNKKTFAGNDLFEDVTVYSVTDNGIVIICYLSKTDSSMFGVY